MEEDFIYYLKRLFGWFESKQKIELIARHKLLHAIQELLEESHHANEDYQIPVPDPSIYNAMSIAIKNEYDHDANKYFLENAEKMNEGQIIFIYIISTKITNCKGGVFSLDAFAGAKKIFCQIYYWILRARHIKYPQ